MSDMLSKIKYIKYRGIILWRRVCQILSQPINALLAVLVVLLIALLFFFAWALLTNEGGAVARLLEIDDKAEVLRLIGWGMGGVLATIGVIALNRRATAMETGLIDERFKAAVQGLAGEQPSVRIAAFYQFYYLAKDNPDVGFRSSIFDILCAHLRQITSDADYRKNIGSEKPTEECQSLLDVLFKKSSNIFVGMEANMQNTHLVGANLSYTELQYADFRGADVSEVDFSGADMSEARFWTADALGARFWDADLSAAGFWGTDVSGATFWDANLLAAEFHDANVSGAEFNGADVSSADFKEANLHGADFSSAKDIGSAKFSDIRIDAKTKFPEWFREGEHYTVAKEEK